MKSPELTRWLEIVWDALNEHDELERNRLLQAADAFLQTENDQAETALPFGDDAKTAA